MFRTLLFALLALMTCGPAFAQSQQDAVQAQLRLGWQLADGHYMTAIDLHLSPDWKTYWRAPGDAGIPPRFDWTGSKNLKQVEFHWPSPQVIKLNGLTSIGYLDELILPVEVIAVDPAKPVDLVLNMDLGVCNDICLPAHLTLSGMLSGPGAPDARITAALHAGPQAGKAAGLSAITCEAEPIKDGMRLTARLTLPAQGKEETVVFETPDPQLWVSSATTHREGGVLVSMTELVPPDGAPFALDRSGVTVTVLAPDHSVEIKGCPAS